MWKLPKLTNAFVELHSCKIFVGGYYLDRSLQSLNSRPSRIPTLFAPAPVSLGGLLGGPPTGFDITNVKPESAPCLHQLCGVLDEEPRRCLKESGVPVLHAPRKGIAKGRAP